MWKKFQDFMQGRYGRDQLSRFTSIIIWILIIISFFIGHSIATWAALALIIWDYFRFFSRNIEKRKKENERFLKIVRKLTKGKFGHNNGRFNGSGGYGGYGGFNNYNNYNNQNQNGYNQGGYNSYNQGGYNSYNQNYGQSSHNQYNQYNQYNQKDTYQERKDYLYTMFTCPECSQKVRIPKDKGTIIITCPKCKYEFQRRT